MIIGIGNDIVSVKRIKNAFNKFGSRFEKRIYTENERNLAWSRGAPCFRTLSNRWAAKEAFVKALGTGFRNGVLWKDIEIINNLIGRPKLVVKGKAMSYLKNVLLPDTSPLLHLTISDEKKFVSAVVIIETRRLFTS